MTSRNLNLTVANKQCGCISTMSENKNNSCPCSKKLAKILTTNQYKRKIQKNNNFWHISSHEMSRLLAKFETGKVKNVKDYEEVNAGTEAEVNKDEFNFQWSKSNKVAANGAQDLETEEMNSSMAKTYLGCIEEGKLFSSDSDVDDSNKTAVVGEEEKMSTSNYGEEGELSTSDTDVDDSIEPVTNECNPEATSYAGRYVCFMLAGLAI